MASQFKLLLISNKANAGYNIAPPLGLYQLQAYVTQRGLASELLDRELEDPDVYLERAAAGDYDVIGYSVSHDKMGVDLDLLWQFKAAVRRAGKDALFIAGGQEAALNDKQWLGLGIDVCFLGFAEKTLLDFCRRVEQRGGAAGVDLTELCAGLNGVSFKDGTGEVARQPSLPLCSSEFRELFFDNIRTVDIPYHRYWDKLRVESADTTLGASDFIIENVRLYTTSHCPRRCGFCNSQSFLPRSQGTELAITMLSAAEVRDLMMHMVHKYGARGFLFSDDDFPVGNRLGIERLEALCRMIIEMKGTGELARETRFACQARVLDFVLRAGEDERRPNIELLKVMFEAGFGSVGMGVETFSDRLLKMPSVNKLGVTSSDCKMVIEAMLEIGLIPQINMIIGIPESTPDELAHTITTAVGYLVRGCDIAVTKHLLALPGAPIYGTDTYELRTRSWVHPETGAEELIADHYLPQHDLIRSVSERFDDKSAAELAAVIAEHGWAGKIIHKRVVGMCSLIAIANLLGQDELEARLRTVLADIIGKRATRRNA